MKTSSVSQLKCHSYALSVLQYYILPNYDFIIFIKLRNFINLTKIIFSIYYMWSFNDLKKKTKKKTDLSVYDFFKANS